MFAQAAVDHAQENSPHRIPSLDGCRAISILLVILAHLCDTPAFQPFDPYARLMFHFGHLEWKSFSLSPVSSSRLFCSTKSAGMAGFPSKGFTSGVPSKSGRSPMLIYSLWPFLRGIM